MVTNATDGASGVIDADDAGSDDYERIGIDSEAVAITHPWVRMEAGESPWTHIKDMSNAVASYKCGVDASGTFVFRSLFGTAYPPSSAETISSAQSIVANIESKQINEIVIHGDKIVKYDRLIYLWIASYSGDLFDQDKAGNITESIANGASWPNTTTYPHFVAEYGDVG